jgi:GNAT superfamily N-acetyltransferase
MYEWHKQNYLISTDPSKIDVDAAHDFLSRVYWSEGIPKTTLKRAIENSLCFGLFQNEMQIGFARLITDRTTFAYLCDVYVLEGHRGKGLATWLMECIVGHPDLHGLRRFCLFTKDAHKLYSRFGFTPMKNTDRYMEIFQPGIYMVAKK